MRHVFIIAELVIKWVLITIYMKVKIKPLSVNKCWQGRRFRTKEYDAYEREMFLLLPKLEIPKGKLMLTLIFGFSNTASDIDNPEKPMIDILQKKYGFNDKMIYTKITRKVIVPKGKEYIDFVLSSIS